MKPKINIFLKQSAFITISSFSKLFSMSFLYWAIARGSDIDSFGSFSSAFQIIMLALVFCDYGFELIVFKETSSAPMRAKEILYKYIPIKILLIFIIFISIEVITPFMTISKETKEYLLILGPYLVFTSLSNGLTAYLRGIGEYKYESIISIYLNSIIIILSLLFLFYKIELTYILVALVVLRLVNVALYVNKYTLIRDFNLNTNLRNLRTHFKDMGPYGIHIIFGSLFYLVDTFVLLSLSGEKSVAIYQAYFKILALILIFSDIVNITLLNRISNEINVNGSITKNIVIGMSQNMYIISLFILSGLWVYSEVILDIIYNNTIYTSYYYILQMFLFVSIIRYLVDPFLTLMVVSGNQNKRLKISIIISLFSVIGNIITIPFYGFNGAILILVLTHILLLFLVNFMSTIKLYSIFNVKIILLSLSILITIGLHYLVKHPIVFIIPLSCFFILRLDRTVRENLEFI